MIRFLWKGDLNSNGGVKASWDTICKSKIEGGLGVKNPVDWNKAQFLYICGKLQDLKQLLSGPNGFI